MRKKRSMVIIGGATGGHVFPAVALAQELARRKVTPHIVFVVAERVHSFWDVLPKGICQYIVVPDVRRSGNVIVFMRDCVRVLFISWNLICRVRPSHVIGFGGLLTGIFIFSALLLQKKTIIHEQNIAWGITTRVLAPFVTLCAVSFSTGKTRKNISCVGNLLRNTLIDKAKQYTYSYPEEGKKVLLVLGGSQGAIFINKIVAAMIALLTPEEIKELHLIHIIGSRDSVADYAARYAAVGVSHQIYPFCNHIASIYTEASLVIARAGAGTLSELTAFGIPALIIPYPYARGHQKMNAWYIAERGGCEYLDEKKVSPYILKEKVFTLLRNKEQCMALAQRAHALGCHHAHLSFADAIMHI